MNANDNAALSCDPDLNIQTAGATIEGMDDFFPHSAVDNGSCRESTGAPALESDCLGQLDIQLELESAIAASLTIKQAVHYYDLPAKQIRHRIKSGEIKALRLGGESGRKWRVFPQGLPQSLLAMYESELPAIEADDPSLAPAFESVRSLSEPDRPIETGDSSSSWSTESVLEEKVAVRDLLMELHGTIRDLEEKLEAAAYRNGYLEAQVEGLESRIKLISLKQYSQPWWRRIFRLPVWQKTCQEAAFGQ